MCAKSAFYDIDRDTLYDLWSEVSATEIASFYKVSKVTVANKLRDYFGSARETRAKKEVDENQFKKFYQLHGICDTAEHFGIGTDRVYRLIKELELPRRGIGGQKQKKLDLRAPQAPRKHKRYNQSKRYSGDRGSIWDALDDDIAQEQRVDRMIRGTRGSRV